RTNEPDHSSDPRLAQDASHPRQRQLRHHRPLEGGAVPDDGDDTPGRGGGRHLPGGAPEGAEGVVPDPGRHRAAGNLPRQSVAQVDPRYVADGHASATPSYPEVGRLANDTRSGARRRRSPHGWAGRGASPAPGSTPVTCEK